MNALQYTVAALVFLWTAGVGVYIAWDGWRIVTYRLVGVAIVVIAVLCGLAVYSQ